MAAAGGPAADAKSVMGDELTKEKSMMDQFFDDAEAPGP